MGAESVCCSCCVRDRMMCVRLHCFISHCCLCCKNVHLKRRVLLKMKMQSLSAALHIKSNCFEIVSTNKSSRFIHKIHSPSKLLQSYCTVPASSKSLSQQLHNLIQRLCLQTIPEVFSFPEELLPDCQFFHAGLTLSKTA